MRLLPELTQKYPDKGTTIFTKMTALANEYIAINLSQGFPDFEIDEGLIESMQSAVQKGFNQYAPMAGLPALQQAIAQKVKHYQNISIEPKEEITITPGATYAIYTALACIISAGDEVIVLEPAYDSYIPNIYAHGGVPVCVPLQYPHFAVAWELVEKAITNKTKAIIINNPHNPCGTVWTDEDLQNLEKLAVQYGLYVVADEVYEHIVFDNKIHLSVLKFSGLVERSFVIHSFGKVFQNTGWKVGYCIAPKNLTAAFRKQHQYLSFSVNTPSQYAIAQHLQNNSTLLTQYATLLQQKRDLFLNGMKDTPFQCFQPSQGSYFQLMDYSAISNLPEEEFAIWLTKEFGVATIPLHPFYNMPNIDKRLVRFCFAKKDKTILAAIDRLKKC